MQQSVTGKVIDAVAIKSRLNEVAPHNHSQCDFFDQMTLVSKNRKQKTIDAASAYHIN